MILGRLQTFMKRFKKSQFKHQSIKSNKRQPTLIQIKHLALAKNNPEPHIMFKTVVDSSTKRPQPLFSFKRWCFWHFIYTRRVELHEMRIGDKDLQQVYQAELMNKMQKPTRVWGGSWQVQQPQKTFCSTTMHKNIQMMFKK